MAAPLPYGLLWALASSLLVHGAAYGSLLLSPPPSGPPSLPNEVEFAIAPVRKPERPVAPPEPPEPKPEPEPRVPVQKQPAAPLPAPTPVPETPVDLSGVTLSNESGDSTFAMAVSHGERLEVSARAPRPASPTPSSRPSPVPPSPPSIVPLGDLSSRPAPPSLEASLLANYPEDARRRGLGGTASVRARIDADGLVRKADIVQELAGGFGSACRRALLGSRWTPPRDRWGRVVATEVRYTCRFVVQP